MRLQDAADDPVAVLEHGILLALLADVVRVLVGGDGEVLPERRDVGYRRAHIARRLRLERRKLLRREALPRECDESHAHAPHVVLLSGAVQLDGQHVGVQIRELGEQGILVDALLVDEPEVRVVEDHDDPLLLCCGLDCGHDLLRILQRCGVACGVVREVEYEKLLVARAEQGLLHGGGVKASVPEGVERLHLRAAGVGEYERVVVPVQIRGHHRVALVRKQLRAHAQAMSKRVGDHRVREPLAIERGVLPNEEFPPDLAQGGKTEAARVQERLAAERNVLGEAVHNEWRAILLERHAYRGVYAALFGLGPLAENAAEWKVHAPPLGGQKTCRRAKRLVQTFCQCVHDRKLYHMRTDFRLAIALNICASRFGRHWRQVNRKPMSTSTSA